MCGRFFVADESDGALLAQMLAEAERREMALIGKRDVARGEVFPGSTVAAIAAGKSGHSGVFPMRWGLRVSSGNSLLINTRSETALDKPLFRPSMLERRCLIPCSWYFEWEIWNAQQHFMDRLPSLQVQAKEPSAKGKNKNTLKIKYAIRPKAPGIVYLAGIYRYEDNEKLPALSILTREPSPDIAFIHDRMPVLFSELTRKAWLDPQADPKALLSLCEMDMAFHTV